MELGRTDLVTLGGRACPDRTHTGVHGDSGCHVTRGQDGTAELKPQHASWRLM